MGASAAPHRCDRCASPMVERHCELACIRCGFRRDCSDP
jgi:8-oxo-dGTP diphosphatase